MKEKIRVLIADDNIEFAMTLNGYLEKDEDMEEVIKGGFGGLR